MLKNEQNATQSGVGENIEPLNCPFCGGISHAFRLAESGLVRCVGEGKQFDHGCGARLQCSTGLADAVDRWNRRDGF